MRIELRWPPIRGAPSRIALIACLGHLALSSAPVSAQSHQSNDTGLLLVRVRHADSTPLPGAFVRSGRLAGVADTAGVAQIELPATLRTIVVSAPGLESRSFEMTIVAGVPNRVDIVLAPARAADADLPSTALRREVRVGDQPVPVEVLSGEQLADAAFDRPTDLLGVLDRSVLVTPQAVNGPLGGHRPRIQGLPGDLTGMLVDGLPVLGGYPGSFAAVQLTPLEFERVEIVRGAGSSWFGPTVGAGAVNLVSRRPIRTTARLQAHQSSEKGGDILFWGATRASPTVGATVLADFHQQRLVDSDEDSWAEFPRAIRFAIRPRLFVDRPNGDGLVVSAGALTEERTGGYLLGATGSGVYREERRTRQANGSVVGWLGDETSGRLQLRAVVGGQRVSYTYDGNRLRDHRTSVFGELSYTRALGPVVATGGLAYQSDAVYDRDLVGFDFSHGGPAMFGQASVTRSRWAGSGGVRCDAHNRFGTRCGANLAVLVRPIPSLALRLAGGRGWYAPTPYTDETETADLRGLVPSELDAVILTNGIADLRWTRGGFEGGVLLSYDRILDPVRAVSVVGDAQLRLQLVNLPGPTRIRSATVRAGYRRGAMSLRASFTRQEGTESDSAVGDARRALDHLPRSVAALDAGLRIGAEGDGRINLIARYVGEQAVWDNPYRTRADGYLMADVVLSQRTGRARLYLSAENLLDVKLADREPVILPVPWAGRRRTTMPWRPVRGRVVSLGAAFEW
jgi:iron complex outermembrane receptor protein